MTSTGNGRDKDQVPVGAALVVGAGIAGMQVALDLAEAGIKVYLLDRSPAIGGSMAMLDKTFPTNDCAMCIMSPKLVEVGRHLNIELLNCAEITGISGEPGNFTVSVRQHPRYVDLETCTGCGDCVTVCPIDIPDEFNGGLSQRKAIYKLYPQAIPNAYAIDKRGVAPCRDACPIHQRVQGYLALTAAGRFADAYCTILEDNPFPSICGRVCNHRCEAACNRAQADEPVNIMAIKRFVADWAWEHWGEVQSTLDRNLEVRGKELPLAGKQIAIVGSGPAGLTCAWDLARAGCAVTIFEAMPVAGGMMRVGVPAHRLPAEVIQREIDVILSQSIELKLNHRIDNLETLLDTFDAVFLAIGAHLGIRLPIPGNNLPGVLLATEFLREVRLADDKGLVRSMLQGRRVLVLGGGAVAIDVAMTAVRLGADWVGLTCLERRDQMPAHEWEIRDAQEEDIQLYPARTFKEVTSETGKVTGVRTVEVDFRGFVDGRPDFDELAGTETIIPADVVIFAVGQRPESSSFTEVVRQRGGYIQVDPDTLATNIPGIFAGGDVVTGTAFIVDAIAAGHHAARSIRAYLQGHNVWQEKIPPVRENSNQNGVARLSLEEVTQRLATNPAANTPRIEIPRRPIMERRGDFVEIYEGLNENQAKAEANRCLHCGVCSECNQCVYVCRAGAIQHDDSGRQLTLKVGAVVLAPGLEPMPGDIRPEYGYGRFPNVITSMQFERMLSASGPFGGIIQRPSDGAHPRKVAWIQCVGSRDCTDGRAPYCSTVCCMYTTKEALIAKEHDPSLEPTIFYIDIRAFGKGFEAYIDRAEKEYGVRYVRCLVSTVREVPGKHNLRLEFVTYAGEVTSQPILHEEEFDLVVLAVGLRPSQDTHTLAERLGVKLNSFGFAETRADAPTLTSQPGIFVAGSFAEPKDIPESVIEASCTAAQVSGLLANVRGSLTRIPEYPPERDITDEPVRVGVFICHCGINIGGVVNVPEVVEYARNLPDVVYAEHNLYTCSQDTQERIRLKIEEHHLNRVMVASCTPRTHESLFQDTLRQAGLNAHLFEMANIREQDAWVHRSNHRRATDKAKQLVRMSVAKARKLRPITARVSEVEPRALVIGGGQAGMTAALSIARQGFEAYLVECQADLGGNFRHIFTRTPDGLDPQALLCETIAAVHAEPRIEVLTEAEVVDISGYKGHYHSTIRQANGSSIEIHHGVILVATGGQEITSHEYLHGQHPRVMTQRILEEKLENELFVAGLAGKTLVMIQCVGSRDDDHPYCSRICCSQALKNALWIKKQAPNARVLVLYRDLRSYGFRELWYSEARKAGVTFLEYDKSNKPRVKPAAGERTGEQLEVEVAVQPENKTIHLTADWLVLSTGIEPDSRNSALAQLLKVPLNETGFFLEAHVKLRPVDFAADGIFLCGLAHSPCSFEESITQAQAAAIRAVRLLSKPHLEAMPLVARVNPRLCTACGLCVEICPYGARRLEPGMSHAEVIEVLCQGCGACVAACPNKASEQKGFEFQTLFGMISAAV